MRRLYHNYEDWEDFKFGMYNNPPKKVDRSEVVVNFFKNPQLTEEYMRRVTNEWTIACEQVFTNPSMNKVAWLGQASLCLYSGITESEVRKAWWLLSEEERNQADNIAKKVIKEWEIKNEERIRD